MGTSAQESLIWKQIDDAEYYLVSGSFEQAMLAALSVVDQIRMASLESACDQDELLEMLESTGMVLVQALKELRRTPEMFVQLKTMFGSVPSVPARVFLTGPATCSSGDRAKGETMAPLPTPSPAHALPTRVSAPPSSGRAAAPLAGARTRPTSSCPARPSFARRRDGSAVHDEGLMNANDCCIVISWNMNCCRVLLGSGAASFPLPFMMDHGSWMRAHFIILLRSKL
ncbi:uncharacterized protein [Miscanthus floridulus]|uniref:uncharacterized protein n=1 Tax=Miscanthus floridulus TaxID=154761 RepID=UPI00345B07D3